MTIEESEVAERRPIDKKALLAKYIAERDKRLRADGNAQYLQVKGHLAHYLDDPYTPFAERAPKTIVSSRELPPSRLAP